MAFRATCAPNQLFKLADSLFSEFDNTMSQLLIKLSGSVWHKCWVGFVSTHPGVTRRHRV